MLKKRIIPCLDVKDGRVVKGVKFENLRDVGDPAELAVRYEQEGADEVVFLDITASKEARGTFLETVRRTAEQLFIPLTVGGGVRTIEDIDLALKSGADKVSINTAALEHPEVIEQGAKRYGAQCIVIAIDAKQVAPGKWEVFTHGGSKPTGIDAVEWARKVAALGAGEILLTSMDRDGTKEGYDLALTRAVAEAAKIPVVASGGAGKVEHFRDALLAADAALAASLFHDRVLSVKDAKAYLLQEGIPVRV